MPLGLGPSGYFRFRTCKTCNSIKMCSVSMHLRRNLFPRTHNFKILAGFRKSKTTEARPLQNQESMAPETDDGCVRLYDDIPASPNFKFNLQSFAQGYRIYKMSEGATKFYKVASMQFGVYGPIYKQPLAAGSDRVIHVMDPSDFETVFRAEGKYPRRPPIEPWKEYARRRKSSPGIAISDGEEWRRIRQSIAPKVMRPKIVEENIGNFNSVTKDAIARFVKLNEGCGPDDHIPDLEGELSKWSTESIGTVAFDARLGLYQDPAQPEALTFIEEVKNIMTLTHKLMVNPFARFAMQRGIDTPTFKKYMKCVDTVHKIGQGFVSKKISELKEMNEKKVDLSDDTQVVPVLTYLLTRGDLTPEEVSARAIELVGGGVDNTSSAALWLLYNLARFPHIQEKLYQEVKSVMGEDEEVKMRHLANLPYLKACMKESLRVTPVTLAHARIISEDVVLSGYHVPADTCVIMHTYCTSQSEKYFKEPMKFKPERWLRQNKDEIHAFSHLPFGFGTRMCLGLRVAELEMRVFVCKLLQRFRLEYHHEPLEPYQKLIAVPDKPVKIKFIDRF